MDWNNWEPVDRATLCFVVSGGRILLIRKLRGLGAGKINGPGGRIEPGETPLAAAVRETQEELLVTPTGLELRGELYFQFLDGYSLHCCVYFADDLIGEPGQTDEAIPLWTPLDAIPFHEMWEDDRHWLPGAIEGRTFRAFFVFDGEKLLEGKVDWVDL